MLFVPLAVLPARVGVAVLLVCGIVCYAWVAVRLGASRVGLVALLLSSKARPVPSR